MSTLNSTTVPTISVATLQLARCLGLVKQVKAVRTSSRYWGLLVEGRGFRRLLEAEALDAPWLHRPTTALQPRALEFFSQRHATARALSIGFIL